MIPQRRDSSTRNSNLDIASYLHSGANTLRFAVYARNSVSFGLDYSGLAINNSATFVEFSDTTVPEPATLAMLGVALIGVGLIGRRGGKANAA